MFFNPVHNTYTKIFSRMEGIEVKVVVKIIQHVTWPSLEYEVEVFSRPKGTSFWENAYDFGDFMAQKPSTKSLKQFILDAKLSLASKEEIQSTIDELYKFLKPVLSKEDEN